MKKSKTSILMVVLIVAMLLTACGGGAASESSEVRDSITLAKGEPTTMDPHACDNSASLAVIINVSEALVRYNEATREFMPAAAESWDISEDGKEYTFHLYEGNKFHNGNDLTAEDVKFSYERAMASPFTVDKTSCINKVEVIDDYTVKIILDYGYNPFMTFAASASLVILDQETVESAGDEYGFNPVGSGPYKISEWASGEKMILEAYEDYHFGPAAIKTVTLKFVEDQSTTVIALQNGEFDILENVPPVDKQMVMDDEDLSYYETVFGGMDFMLINNEVPHFSDKRVRQALAYVVDYASIVDVLTEGSGYVADSFIPSSIFGYDESSKAYPKDVEKARQLLKEAGYEDGFTTSIMVNEENGYRVAQVIQANLKEVGIDCEIKMYEYGTFLDLEASGGYELSFDGFGYYGDADPGLYPLFHSDNIDSSNRPRYNNKAVDELLEVARVEQDREKRLEMYSELNKILMEDMPAIPLDVCSVSVAAHKDLKGVSASGESNYYYYDYYWDNN